MTGAAAMWAAVDLRRRWRSLVVLGVLGGLSAGLCLAALAGARRTATAFPRLRAVTHSADAVVFATQVGVVDPDWRKLAAQPYVERLARWNLLFGDFDGERGGPLFAPSDGVWLQEVDRPVVIHGRMFDADRPDEVVVTEGLVKEGVRVGRTFRFRFYERGKSDLDGEPPTGPELTLRVVGVVRDANGFLFTDGIVTSPALMRTYGTRISAFENTHVRLTDWRTGMPRLKRDVDRLVAPGVPVLDLHQVEARVSTSIAVEQSALLLLAAAVGAAGLVFVGQALVRSVLEIERDAGALRPLGFTRRDLVTAATLPHAVVALLATAVGTATAIVLSPRFPIGLARRVDPVRGIHVDLAVLVPGAVATALLVLGGSLVVAARGLGRPAPAREPRADGAVAALRRILPLPVGLGATMALQGSTGGRPGGARPARMGAMLGAIVGVLGLAGAVTLVHGLDDALANPSRVGVTWDAGVAPAATSVDPKAPDRLRPQVLRRIEAAPGVADVSVLWRAVLDADGVGVPTFASVPRRGDIDLVTVAGRAPSAADEVAIGPATGRQLQVGIGDHVTVAGHRLRIVGRALFPNDVHSGFDEGLLVTWPNMKRLSPTPDPASGVGAVPYVAVRWRPGVGPQAGLRSLTSAVDDPLAQVAPADVPQELANLRNVRRIPIQLAAFLVLIAVSTLSHALIASLRARRQDFAVLRALGFTRSMVASIVVALSTVLGLVGLLVGLPVGVAAGRAAWTWIATRVPLVYVSPVVLGLTLALVPLTVVVVNLTAAWPGRRAARLKVAEVLRTE